MVKKLSHAAAIAGAVAFAALAAAPAQAMSVPSRAESGAYHLEVERADGSVETATLVCPSGQGHPYGSDVCGQLADAGGDITALAPADRMCTFEYRPVTLRAHGMWEGRFQSYEAEFGNYCTAVDMTGGQLFDLTEN